MKRRNAGPTSGGGERPGSRTSSRGGRVEERGEQERRRRREEEGAVGPVEPREVEEGRPAEEDERSGLRAIPTPGPPTGSRGRARGPRREGRGGETRRGMGQLEEPEEQELGEGREEEGERGPDAPGTRPTTEGDPRRGTSRAPRRGGRRGGGLAGSGPGRRRGGRRGRASRWRRRKRPGSTRAGRSSVTPGAGAADGLEGRARARVCSQEDERGEQRGDDRRAPDGTRDRRALSAAFRLRLPSRGSRRSSSRSRSRAPRASGTLRFRRPGRWCRRWPAPPTRITDVAARGAGIGVHVGLLGRPGMRTPCPLRILLQCSNVGTPRAARRAGRSRRTIRPCPCSKAGRAATPA